LSNSVLNNELPKLAHEGNKMSYLIKTEKRIHQSPFYNKTSQLFKKRGWSTGKKIWPTFIVLCMHSYIHQEIGWCGKVGFNVAVVMQLNAY